MNIYFDPSTIPAPQVPPTVYDLEYKRVLDRWRGGKDNDLFCMTSRTFCPQAGPDHRVLSKKSVYLSCCRRGCEDFCREIARELAELSEVA